MSEVETDKAWIRDKVEEEPAFRKWKKEDGRKGTFGYRKIARILGQILTGQFKAVRVETRKERKQIRRAKRKQLLEQKTEIPKTDDSE